MADFYTPVRIPREAFHELIARVDQAVGEHTVALLLNEDYPFRALDPINPTAIDFSGIALEEDPLEVVEYLDQLLYFAFERSSREAIAYWAREENVELRDEAIERVKFIRGNMPQLADLWEAKSDSITPPLTGFAYETVNVRGDELPRANIYVSAARIMPGGAPDKTDMLRLRIQLWPSDVRMIINELSHLWEAHLASSSNKPNGDDGSGTANGTVS